MNIIDFLHARIAENEAEAHDATGARWVVLPGVNASMVNIDPTNVRDEKWKYGRFGHVATTSHDAAYAEHIARHDPARVLAECAAKRAIINQAIAASDGHATVIEEFCLGEPAKSEAYANDPGLLIIRALAAVYKDHPDYQQEWAVGG